MRYRCLLLSICLVGAIGAICSCGASQDNSGDMETHKMLAGELQENHLYPAAIEEYQSVLSSPGLDKTKRANINFLIGKIYFDNMKDYEKAAAYFVRARALDPNGSFISEVSQNLVVCLERSGRMLDAKRELGSATAVDTTAHSAGDVAVAKIDGQPVWRSELEAQIQQLPPSIQKQLLSRDARVQYLRNYVGVELLYRAAQREHMDADPTVQRQKDLLFKRMLVQKYVEDKVMPQVSIDTADVRNFYLANKDTRYKGMPYDSARAQAFMDYESQKTESAYGDYIQKLAAASKVEFLDQNVK
jgi:tetratricopeptide (TPR) repeat protein